MNIATVAKAVTTIQREKESENSELGIGTDHRNSGVYLRPSARSGGSGCVRVPLSQGDGANSLEDGDYYLCYLLSELFSIF